MGNLFNRVMRIVSTLLGELLVAVGGAWIPQGLDIAFLDSFMAGQVKWAFYGAILVPVGIGQISGAIQDDVETPA